MSNETITTGNKQIDWVIARATDVSTIDGVVDLSFVGKLPARMISQIREYVRDNGDENRNLHFADGLVTVRFVFSPYKGNNRVRMAYHDFRVLAETHDRIDPDA